MHECVGAAQDQTFCTIYRKIYNNAELTFVFNEEWVQIRVVDSHNHIGRRIGWERSVEDLMREMDHAGIDMAVVFPIALAGKIDNDYVANAVKKYPDRLIGFATVDPQFGDSAVEELERCVTKLGLKGLKLHPDGSGYPIDDHTKTDPIFEVCAKHRIPVISHAQGDNPRTMPLQFEEMAKTFPDVTIMMAHMGAWQSTYQAIRVAKRNDNLFLETAGNPFVGEISWALKEVGAHKIIMGTDTPFGDFEVSLKIIEKAVSKAEERNLVRGGNLEKILGI